MRIQGATVFDGANLLADVSVKVSADGLIEALDSIHATDRACGNSVAQADSGVELDGGYLCPGFVDLQVNGGGGVMLNDDPSAATLRCIAQAHLSLGTTSFLPTLITDQSDKVSTAVAAVEQAIADGVPGIAGLHLEGPHLSVEKKGAHPQQHIRAMTAVDMDLLLQARQRLPVLKVTVAPENVSPQQIEQLNKAGVVVALGHSNAGYDDCLTSFNAGASCATHLFNAMSQLSSREPGLVGATLDNESVACGLIVDGHHVDYVGVRLAVNLKSRQRLLYLVSDAMAVAGSELAEFTLQGRTVRRSQGCLTLPDGTLAGADLSMEQALRNTIRYGGAALSDALSMVTSVPARVVGLGGGSIKVGGAANLVWLDNDYRVRRIWYRGVER